ncbi:Putative membrane protein, conserved [Thermococcus nautili]|uniref:hypothetical protein n=1 Tax=Thermococcus nautili TaxID=195522 RepID=UPI00255355D2|nr:hypothetical protein [Thermococcus nautili]CAI1492479.1 Putative membrane protein, conserved [Thermococcus nautili]
MRVFVKDYLIPWFLAVGFWLAIWTFVRQIRENLNAVNVFVAFLLLVPFLLVAFHFVGKTLERYGYSREDIRRLPEIIEKTHGRLYLPKEVFETVTRALMFWGLVATAVVMTENPLKGLLNGVAIFVRILALFVLFVSMVLWVMDFPFALYKLFKGRDLSRDFLVEMIRQNLLYTAILIAVRLIALHSSYPAGNDPIGEVMAIGRKTGLVKFLLELSGLNFLYCLIGLYLPKKSRKLVALALTVIVVIQLWISLRIIFG